MPNYLNDLIMLIRQPKSKEPDVEVKSEYYMEYRNKISGSSLER